MKIINLIENNPNVDFSIPFKMALESGENRITGINTLNRNFIKLKTIICLETRIRMKAISSSLEKLSMFLINLLLNFLREAFSIMVSRDILNKASIERSFKKSSNIYFLNVESCIVDFF